VAVIFEEPTEKTLGMLNKIRPRTAGMKANLEEAWTREKGMAQKRVAGLELCIVPLSRRCLVAPVEWRRSKGLKRKKEERAELREGESLQTDNAVVL
jgi:hypothetical protein